MIQLRFAKDATLTHKREFERMLHSKCVLALLGSSLIVQLVCAQTTPASSPLTISAVSSTATPETATVSWTTNVPATSRLDYGTSRDALVQHVEDSQYLTQHSLTITGLTAGTTYIVQITSVTAGGEKATQIVGKAEPAPAAAPAAAAGGRSRS